MQVLVHAGRGPRRFSVPPRAKSPLIAKCYPITQYLLNLRRGVKFLKQHASWLPLLRPHQPPRDRLIKINYTMAHYHPILPLVLQPTHMTTLTLFATRASFVCLLQIRMPLANSSIAQRSILFHAHKIWSEIPLQDKMKSAVQFKYLIKNHLSQNRLPVF